MAKHHLAINIGAPWLPASFALPPASRADRKSFIVMMFMVIIKCYLCTPITVTHTSWGGDTIAQNLFISRIFTCLYRFYIFTLEINVIE